MIRNKITHAKILYLYIYIYTQLKHEYIITFRSKLQVSFGWVTKEGIEI